MSNIRNRSKPYKVLVDGEFLCDEANFSKAIIKAKKKTDSKVYTIIENAQNYIKIRNGVVLEESKYYKR